MSADEKLAEIAMLCAHAVAAGLPTVTISVTGGKRPAGWPRGELLSVGTNGAKNYAIDPIKLMAWVHVRTKRAGATHQGGAA